MSEDMIKVIIQSATKLVEICAKGYNTLYPSEIENMYSRFYKHIIEEIRK